MRHDLLVSIVSHGQKSMVYKLLNDFLLIANSLGDYLIVIRCNFEEGANFKRDFPTLPIQQVVNLEKYGYGENHNLNFSMYRSKMFWVLNPDIRLVNIPFDRINNRFSSNRLAVLGPLVLSPNDDIEDNARADITLTNIISRVLFKNRSVYDHTITEPCSKVDWLAGMCLFFSSNYFEYISGFDTRFFMYLEDADICRRLRLSGFEVAYDNSIVVIHDAQRASHRNIRFLIWHIKSLARYLLRYSV